MSRASLEGIPETIGRCAYQELIAGAGFDLKRLLSLEFEVDGIYAEVYAEDENGDRFTVDGENLATDRVCVRVVDEEPETPA